MAKIPQDLLINLRSKKLFVSEPFPAGHTYPDGVLVGKPQATQGNSIPGYENSYANLKEKSEVYFDAPPLFFYSNYGKWFVHGHDHCPGPGVGDFLDEWNTAADASTDILDFFFGDSTRMKHKEQGRRHPPIAGPELRWLATQLGEGWQGKCVATVDSLDALLKKGSWSAEFRAPDGKLQKIRPTHSLVVDGLDDVGNIRIRDSAEGTRYEMRRKDFLNYWSGNCVFRD